jgi:V8-like Glu-specific endopeptidase
MRAAKPADVPAERAAVRRAAVRAADAGPEVTVSGTKGSLPTGNSGPEPRLIATAVPRPYTNLPDRLNGKVFFTKTTGGNFVCSGTVVNNSTSKDLVWTAGHCVADNVSHTFHKNWIFVPAFASASASSTSRPYGTWTARTLATKSAWINTTSPQFKLDLGVAVLNPLNGKHIVNQLGSQGIKFNSSAQQNYNAFGYPQASPFNGLSQFRCNSALLARDNPGGTGPLAMKINCDMTGGASGGGWLIQLNATTGLGFIASHNDYKYNNDPNHMYGPYLGNDALQLYNFAATL